MTNTLPRQLTNLLAQHPGIEVRQSSGVIFRGTQIDGDGFLYVDRDGMNITDPFASECGRFTVEDPEAAYGIPAEIARELVAENCRRETAWRNAFRKGLATADFLPENVALPCFSNDRRWNGWGQPAFELDVAKQLLVHLPDLSFRESDACFVCVYHDDPGMEPLVYAPEQIMVDGEPKTVYFIGAGDWVWDPIEPA